MQNIWKTSQSATEHMWLNISKGTSCRMTGFWVMGMQSQNISKYGIVPKSIVRFHIFWNLQNLIFQLLEGFGAQTVFSCKMDLWIHKIPIRCTDFQFFKSLFSRNLFFTNLLWHPQWNYHISRTHCPISKILAPKLSWKNSHLLNSKIFILIFRDNRSLSMCWVTNVLSNIFLILRSHIMPLLFSHGYYLIF